MLDGLADRQAQFVVDDGLGEVVDSALLDRLHSRLDLAANFRADLVAMFLK